MTFPPQLEIVSDHVEDAREKGARILTGGRRGEGPGDWYEPTVIADADHTMKVMVDETFGPVLGVMKVRDTDEAVAMANDTRYGLSASVMSSDTKRAEAVARRLEVGATNVDDVLTNYFLQNLPMGGWKESGVGVRHGAPGDQAVLPYRGDRHAAVHPGQARPALVPVQAPRAEAHDRPVPLLQRTRTQGSARAVDEARDWRRGWRRASPRWRLAAQSPGRGRAAPAAASG